MFTELVTCAWCCSMHLTSLNLFNSQLYLETALDKVSYPSPTPPTPPTHDTLQTFQYSEKGSDRQEATALSHWEGWL